MVLLSIGRSFDSKKETLLPVCSNAFFGHNNIFDRCVFYLYSMLQREKRLRYQWCIQLRGGGMGVLTGTASNQRLCYIISFMIHAEIQVNNFFNFSYKLRLVILSHRVFPLAASPHPVSTSAFVSAVNLRSIVNPFTWLCCWYISD